jgi:HD-like signal output (HDOD) protein
MRTLQELIREIQVLKPIPAVAGQLLAMADRPGTGMEEMAEVIQYDPVITATVIRTCNSAWFGLKNPAESVRDAVAFLGMDQVIEIALMKSCSKALSGTQDGYGLQDGDLWCYSVSSAVIAKTIATRLRLEHRNTLFTASLVKDIGKIILGRYIAESSQQMAALVENEHFSFREAEKQLFGIDHAELGAMIAKLWKFSPRMVTIIRHHHLADPAMVDNQEIAIVYLADCITMMTGLGGGSDGLAYRFRSEAMHRLGISANDLTHIIADFTDDLARVETLLSNAR